MIALHIILSLAPVILLALLLLLLDSYKLVRSTAAAGSLITGAVAALACMQLNILLLHRLHFDVTLYTRYLAPLLEEGAKALPIWLLIRKKHVGFLVDSAIHGAAIGAGFAVIENISYLYGLAESSLMIWFVRGFGTAVMHASCTALFAILCKRRQDRLNHSGLSCWGLAWLAAAAIHSAFNHFILPPLQSTLVILITFPLFIIAVYENSERALRKWLTLSMDEEMAMLETILSGRFSGSKFGQYMLSLRDHFPPAVVVDLFCYLRIYLELAMRAKGILLLRQHGLPAKPDAALQEKFTEFKYLEKSIGRTGKMALVPFMRITDRELWQLYMLEK
ncbi:MAG TPA: PrsW family glutamic-type intramembrane protease [bacterium]|nr:PrsW family glutamic-type intramembrane protease [bacterium]